jgi:hypothetical protein
MVVLVGTSKTIWAVLFIADELGELQVIALRAYAGEPPVTSLVPVAPGSAVWSDTNPAFVLSPVSITLAPFDVIPAIIFLLFLYDTADIAVAIALNYF